MYMRDGKEHTKNKDKAREQETKSVLRERKQDGEQRAKRGKRDGGTEEVGAGGRWLDSWTGRV